MHDMSNDEDNAPKPIDTTFASEDAASERMSDEARRARKRRVESLCAQIRDGSLRFDWMRVAERMLDRIGSGNKH